MQREGRGRVKKVRLQLRKSEFALGNSDFPLVCLFFVKRSTNIESYDINFSRMLFSEFKLPIRPLKCKKKV